MNAATRYARVPSVETLADAFGADAARKVRDVLTGKVEPSEASDACAAWERACYHRPPWSERAEKACDQFIGGFGVEAIRNCDGDIIAGYINTGDTYAATLLFNYERGTVRVTTLGDFVEAYERRHGYGAIS